MMLYQQLTVVKLSNVKSITFPAVIVKRFCDLRIRNNKIRHSLVDKSYQTASYAASPMDLLWKRKIGYRLF